MDILNHLSTDPPAHTIPPTTLCGIRTGIQDTIMYSVTSQLIPFGFWAIETLNLAQHVLTGHPVGIVRKCSLGSNVVAPYLKNAEDK